MAFHNREKFFPENSLGYLMRVCNQLGVAGLDQVLAHEGVSQNQWSAMVLIHVGQASNGASLAREMAHDKGAMTRLIDFLENKGWVRRDRDDDDRRLVNLSLTAEGTAVTMRCRDMVIERWNSRLADWSDPEIAAFVIQVQKLRRSMESSTREPKVAPPLAEAGVALLHHALDLE